jgi:hypothetical protein
MIELRWLETKEEITASAGFWHTVRTLQYRQLEKVWIPSDPGVSNGRESERWSEWKDIPAVQNIQQDI